MGFPEPMLMVYANSFSLVAALHLAYCHIMVTLWIQPNGGLNDTNGKEWLPVVKTVNYHWLIMTFWWFGCFVCLLIWAHRYGDIWGITGNWIKMAATLLFFCQDAIFLTEDADLIAKEKGLCATMGISLFWIGGVVHTIGFTKLLGFWNTTTIGIAMLMLGAFLLMIFWHFGMAYDGGSIAKKGYSSSRALCHFFTCMGDGLLIGGSAMLLGGIIDVIATEKPAAIVEVSRNAGSSVHKARGDKSDLRRRTSSKAEEDSLMDNI